MCKVSIIMPLYNAEKYVEKAIRSILNQSFNDFELIVINDGSIDNSCNIVSTFNDDRLKFFNNDRNRGIAYTRNRAIELASGEYIAIMDDDDIAPLNRLACEVKYLDEHPDIIAVCGNACRIDENDNDLNELWRVCRSPKRINALFLFGDPVPNSSAMVRRKIIIDNDIRFRENMHGIEDYRFWSEVSLRGLIGSIDEIMLYNRLNHGSESGVQNTPENQKLRRIEFFNTKDILFSHYGVHFKHKEREKLYDTFSECRTTASFSELVTVFPIIIKIAKQTFSCSISREIRQVCYMIYFSTVINSIKTKVTGRKKLWYEYRNRKNVVPDKLKDDFEKLK